MKDTYKCIDMKDFSTKMYQFSNEELHNKLDWMLDVENDLLEEDFIELRNLIVDTRNYLILLHQQDSK